MGVESLEERQLLTTLTVNALEHVGLVAALTVFSMGVFASTVSAELVDVTVSIENLAPTNSITFAPLRVGFHSGVFDAFDEGGSPTAPIISIAEGGSGSDWFPAFEAADPTAVTGTVAAGGPSVPAGNVGQGGNAFSSTATNTFRVDTDTNRFFTFANMAVPSNDLFLGNDSAIELFDVSGNLLVTSISQTGANIWNAGSEEAIALNGAFVVGGTNADRVDENGTVEFSFSEMSVFDGVTTPANYDFDSSLVTRDSEIYRISFSAATVPEPSSVAMLMCGVVLCGFRRRQR